MFNATASPWFDPKSWGTNQVKSNESLRFLLDIEKVPCSKDRVYFPDFNSFSVDMEAKPINIGSMLIHNEVGFVGPISSMIMITNCFLLLVAILFS